jgi:site-specific DNA-methyltransferase (adenine-specific)
MSYLPIADIIILPNRQRKTFDEALVRELAQDIAKPHGLLHPIVLENDGVTLVAGERRLRAMGLLISQGIRFNCAGKLVPENHVPFTTLGELSRADVEEAQLSENIQRRDISWQELVAARASIVELRQEQKVSKRAIAAEITHKPESEVTPQDVQHYVTVPSILAEHLSNPKIAKQKSQSDAYKTLARDMELDLLGTLGSRLDLDSLMHRCHHGDMRDIISRGFISPETIDCIITDPPYGVYAHIFGSQSKIDHEYDDTSASSIELYDTLFAEAAVLCKPQAHLYAFCDIAEWATLTTLAWQYDWECAPFPIIWDKGHIGIAPNHTWLPRRSYETILYARRGGRPTTGLYEAIIKNIPPVDIKAHAAEKPVALYVELLRRSCINGETILDPFAGSGPVFPAATKLKLTAIGIEKEKRYYDVCIERIANKLEI